MLEEKEGRTIGLEVGHTIGLEEGRVEGGSFWNIKKH